MGGYLIEDSESKKKKKLYLQHYPKRVEISEFLEKVAEFFFCGDCDLPISSCSYVFRYQTQREDGTCTSKSNNS